MQQLFLSTLSLRRATPATEIRFEKINISIHALLAESDYWWSASVPPGKPFLSTLSLRRATPSDTGSGLIDIFLSTLSLRRATAFFYSLTARRQYFYPRSPCGERLEVVQHRIILLGISIHALLAESDYRCGSGYQAGKHFYPRSPCGERPAQHWNSSGR